MRFENDGLVERTTLLGAVEYDSNFFDDRKWRVVSGLIWTLLVTGIWFGVSYVTLYRQAPPDVTMLTLFKMTVARALPIVLLVGPAVMIMAAGGLDLSVGSVAGVTSVVTAMAIKQGLGTGDAIARGLGTAVAVGLVNAILTGVVRINGALVTLAVMVLLGNFAFAHADMKTVIPVPEGVLDVLPSSPVTWAIAGAFVLLCAVLVQFTPFGMRIGRGGKGGVGGAVSVGLPYLLSSLAAGVVGILLLCANRVGSPTVGVNLELRVILAVVLGGTVMGCGFGNVTGAVVGAMILVLTQMQLEATACSQVNVAIILSTAVIAAAVLAKVYYGIVGKMYTRGLGKRSAASY